MRDTTYLAKFWSKVQKGERCWLWTGTTDKDGYGRTSWISKGIRGAHCVAYFIAYGRLPKGRIVAHECDNPPCVKPSHLFKTTLVGNARDRHAKGRDARGDRHGWRTHPEAMTKGEHHWKAKLDDEKVRRMREQARLGVPMRLLASLYGIARITVSRVLRRVCWKHVV